MFTSRQGLLFPFFFLLSAGCSAAIPPRELLDAREAFQIASNGAASQHDPADVEIARQALNRAEKAFADNPDAESTRDLAYIAQVKSLTAEARGRRAAYDGVRASADAQFRTAAVNKLDSKNAALERDTARFQLVGAALDAERKQRSAAESRLRDAMDRLTALATTIKEEPRGTVITLSGSVLFATDKSDLLPTASQRLDDVADALNAEPDRGVTILGFTDSTGALAHNQDLSERRAKAVYDYLVEKGVAPDRLSFVGKGPSDPVADNGSVEGRANNRRVEIVVARRKDDDPYR